MHLNDQNGLKYDQDKNIGAANLRAAFNQVRVLEQAGYGKNGEWVGLDVKAMRTQPHEIAFRHLANSKEIFLQLVEVSRKVDPQEVQGLIDQRDYEGLELLIVKNWANKDVAKYLGLTEQAVASYKFQAVGRLKDIARRAGLSLDEWSRI